MPVVKDNRTVNLEVSKIPYSHKICHDAVIMWVYIKIVGKNMLTGGYTFAGTALGVMGDGTYMEGSERD